MTPNPNPSPELIEAIKSLRFQVDFQRGYGSKYIRLTRDEGDLLIAALSTQTLPAPGEVEREARALVQQLRLVIDRLNGQAYSSTLSQLNALSGALASQDREAVNGLQPAPGHADGCGAHDDYRCDCAARIPATVAAANDEGVAELRDLEAKTTRGEWSVAEGSVEDGSIYIDADDTGDRPVAMIMSGSPHNQDRADAAFIVAAVAFARARLATSRSQHEGAE